MKTLAPNLVIVGNSEVYSYDTLVATVNNGFLEVPRYWSKTTSKHINKAADYLGLEVKKLY